MIKYEKEVIEYLGLPSVPKRLHDGTSSFEKGVAIVSSDNEKCECYAVACFNANKDEKPRVIKVFGTEIYNSIKAIYVVPEYMTNEEEIDTMDLDEESKKKAREILKEAREVENDGVETVDDEFNAMPEWIFPHIHNKEEAEAFIRSYRKTNKISNSKLPKNEEDLKTYLMVIYKNTQNNK